MKYLKQFNEDYVTEVKILQEYVATILADFLDEFDCEYKVDKAHWNSSENPTYHVTINVNSEWGNIKDYLIPFVENMINSFEGPIGIYTKDQSNRNKIMHNTISLYGKSIGVKCYTVKQLNRLNVDTEVIKLGFSIENTSVKNFIKNI